MAGEMGLMLRKRMIAILILFGIFIAWIGFVLGELESSLLYIARILGVTGMFFAFAAALAGGLGSQRTTDSQSLGLLVVAAALLLAAAWVI